MARSSFIVHERLRRQSQCVWVTCLDAEGCRGKGFSRSHYRGIPFWLLLYTGSSGIHGQDK